MSYVHYTAIQNRINKSHIAQYFFYLLVSWVWFPSNEYSNLDFSASSLRHIAVVVNAPFIVTVIAVTVGEVVHT